MNKNTLIAILGLAVVVLIAILLSPSPSVCKTCGMEQSSCKEGCGHDPCTCNEPPVETNVWSTTQEKLTPEAVKRLREGPQRITASLSIEGNGERALAGHRDSGHFNFLSVVVARSEVMGKEPRAGSVFTVTEKRTFENAEESFKLHNVDMQFALETLPADEVEAVSGSLCLLANGFWPGLGLAAAGATEGVFATLRRLDGFSVRGLLGNALPKDLSELIDVLAGEEAKREWERAMGRFHSIKGRTFVIVYDQLPDQPVCNVEYRSEDGRPLTEDDKRMLQRINIFLDAEVVPDSVKESEPSTEWAIGVSAIKTMLAGLADGTCSGRLTARREDDAPNGDWRLSVRRGTIVWRAEGGRQNASLDVVNLGGDPERDPAGTAVIDSRHFHVQNLQFTATGSLDDKRSTEYCFGLFPFTFTASGTCRFRSLYSTTPLAPATIRAVDAE